MCVQGLSTELCNVYVKGLSTELYNIYVSKVCLQNCTIYMCTRSVYRTVQYVTVFQKSEKNEARETFKTVLIPRLCEHSQVVART